MAGVKGRSGRGGCYDDLNFEELVAKSLAIQIRFFDDPKIPDEKKVEYASRYLAKRVGEKIDLSVTHSLDSNQMQSLYQRISSKLLNQSKLSPPEIIFKTDDSK